MVVSKLYYNVLINQRISTLRSNPKASPKKKDVNPSIIEEAKVRFIAGSVLKKELKNAKFEKDAEPKKDIPAPKPGA